MNPESPKTKLSMRLQIRKTKIKDVYKYLIAFFYFLYNLQLGFFDSQHDIINCIANGKQHDRVLYTYVWAFWFSVIPQIAFEQSQNEILHCITNAKTKIDFP